MKKAFALKKKLTALIVSMAVLVQAGLIHGTDRAQAAEAPDLKLEATSAILMDAGTGQILYAMDPDTPRPPASMAKMMTEYLVMENIKSGKIKWEDTVTTSKYAADIIGSGQLLANQEKLSVRSMFEAMSIYSGNDASIALAEHIAGTEEEFANMMNETAQRLGMSDGAHFINSTGLDRADMSGNDPKSIQGETTMSAKDAAILAYNILKDHKEILEFTKIPSKKLRETDKSPMINWNWMLEANKDNINFKKYSYPGLDGLKTGSTDNAGYCFTGTAERNGMRLISVVMGTPSEPKRFEETRKLLDYGFTNFEVKQVFPADTVIDSLPTVPVKKGVKTKIEVVTEQGLTLVAKKGSKDEEFVRVAEPLEAAKLVAPIKKGDVLGKVTVTYNDAKYEVNLVAKEDMDKGSWIRLFFRAIKNFFADLLGSIKNLF